MLLILAALSGTEVAAIITAVGGVVAAVLAARKGVKADHASAEALEQKSILEGYGQIVKDLQYETERIRKMYLEDSTAWRTEKGVLLSQIELLQEKTITPRRRKRPPTQG